MFYSNDDYSSLLLNNRRFSLSLLDFLTNSPRHRPAQPYPIFEEQNLQYAAPAEILASVIPPPNAAANTKDLR